MNAVKKTPPLRCPECVARSIGALGPSSPLDDVSVDGGGVDPGWGSESDAVAALCSLSRGAGAKQTTALEPLVTQSSSKRPSAVQALDSVGVGGLGGGLFVPEPRYLLVLG